MDLGVITVYDYFIIYGVIGIVFMKEQESLRAFFHDTPITERYSHFNVVLNFMAYKMIIKFNSFLLIIFFVLLTLQITFFLSYFSLSQYLTQSSSEAHIKGATALCCLFQVFFATPYPMCLTSFKL